MHVHGGAGRTGLEDKACTFRLGCCTKEYKAPHAAGLRWGRRKREPPFVLLFQVRSRPACGYLRKDWVKILLL